MFVRKTTFILINQSLKMREIIHFMFWEKFEVSQMDRKMAYAAPFGRKEEKIPYEKSSELCRIGVRWIFVLSSLKLVNYF